MREQLWSDERILSMIHTEVLRSRHAEYVNANVVFQMLQKVRDDLSKQSRSLKNELELSRPEQPVFLAGEPQNLPAAATDALEWLQWMRPHVERTGAEYTH